ncbi:MAG: hypothetical protein IKY59_06455, partial [Oscillospiraceae bacterium]|nr:hypothetical protein [Oscillospiraceae bacterium]
DKNVEDVATEPHEVTHAPDALRAFCVFRFSGISPSANGQNMPQFYEFTKSTDDDTPERSYGYGERVMVI